MSVCVIGDAFIDVIVPINSIIKGGVTVNNKIKVSAGGTSNVAVWLSRLGIKTAFIGRVGNDAFGRYFKEFLRKEGVEDFVFMDEISETGICVSIIEENERSFIVKRGANDKWNVDMLSIIDEISQYKIIFTTCYLLANKRSREILGEILTLTKENNCEIWLNLASHNIVRTHRKEILNFIYNYADNLVMNIDEATALTGNSIEQTLKTLNKYVNNIIITMGEDGCSIYSKELNKVEHIPACDVKKIVDVTGAGDAFIAGFLAGYAKGHTLEECGRLGNKLAAKVIKKFGAV